LLEGQVPAGLGAAWAFELAKGTFEERADLGYLTEGSSTGLGVPVGKGRFHISKVTYLLNTPNKKRCPKKKKRRETGRQPWNSEFHGKLANKGLPINPKNR
jgi:hypothetical protein